MSSHDEEIMLIPRICPNCGAPVRGDECEYCGSVFKRGARKITVSDTDRPQMVRAFDPKDAVWKYVPYREAKRLCDIYHKLHDEKFLSSWHDSWEELLKSGRAEKQDGKV